MKKLIRSRPLEVDNEFRVEELPLGYHLVKLTPELARFWAETYNTNNRHVQRRKLQDLVTQMSVGRWEDYHPHGISFLYDPDSKELFMSDGQHRCLACAAAGITIAVWVYVDAPPSRAVRGVLDKVAVRSTADNLGRSNHATAVLKRVLFGPAGQAPTGWTDVDYRKMDQRFGWAVDFVVDREPNVRGAAGLKHAGMLATLGLALLYGVDEERIIKFLDILQTGQVTDPKDGLAGIFRDYLIVEVGRKLNDSKETKRSVHIETWYKTQTTLDKFLRGKAQKRLSSAKKEFFLPVKPTLDLDTLAIDAPDCLIEKPLAEKNTLV